jgi:hypothetical protein
VSRPEQYQHGGAMAGARRSFARKRFGPRFSTRLAQGDREERCELTKTKIEGGDSPER